MSIPLPPSAPCAECDPAGIVWPDAFTHARHHLSRAAEHAERATSHAARAARHADDAKRRVGRARLSTVLAYVAAAAFTVLAVAKLAELIAQ